jgi:hypothetical protein
MLQEREDDLHMVEDSPVNIKGKTLIPALICASLSVFFLNGGFLSLFFLAPLGYAAVVYNSFRIVFLMATVINIVFTSVMRYASGGMWLDIFYFVVLSLCFAWIMLGNNDRIRTLYRFIASSAAGTLFLVIFVFSRTGPDFNIMVNAQAEIFSVVFPAVTPEVLVDLLRNIALRGGIMASAFFLFFVNRHMALTAARIINKREKEKPLSAFFVPGNTIWVFSFALLTVILTGILKMQILDIIAWNVLVVCSILFLVQGAGILMFFLARKTPGFRLAVNILIIFMIFSPLGTVAIAALLLLGIAENWYPLRQGAV